MSSLAPTPPAKNRNREVRDKLLDKIEQLVDEDDLDRSEEIRNLADAVEHLATAEMHGRF